VDAYREKFGLTGTAPGARLQGGGAAGPPPTGARAWPGREPAGTAPQGTGPLRRLVSGRARNARRPPCALPARAAKRSNELATFAEARLGKPSHLLGGDRLRQFVANSGLVLRFWCARAAGAGRRAAPPRASSTRDPPVGPLSPGASPRAVGPARRCARTNAHAAPPAPAPPRRCVWDDRSGMYGDRRPYVLHYYLEDDTVEVNEVGTLGRRGDIELSGERERGG
jgi:hypothetical protein